MIRRRPIASVADILIVCLLGALTWLGNHRTPAPHRGLPDKVVVYIHQRPSNDSIRHLISLTNDELNEMAYYLRVHNIHDEGYNLIAAYNTQLTQRRRSLERLLLSDSVRHYSRDTIAARERPLIAVKTRGGYWRAGRFCLGRLSGLGLTSDSRGRVVSALWDSDTIVTAMRRDSAGIYRGQMDSLCQAAGQGSYDALKGCHYEGFWQSDRRHGFGFESSPLHQVRVGEWKNGKFLGERLTYTNERIYGIDISRYQHEIGRRRYGINWRKMRITSLGSKNSKQAAGELNYPVSFVYIKATESTSIRNRYYPQDAAWARRCGIHVGAYHFFSLRTTPQSQADFFLKYAAVHKGDFPPVLDVEPTDAQIAQIGGSDELMRRIRIWMQRVEAKTGKRPILYVSQSFVTKHMGNAADIKQRYNVWIARYSAYKPDVKLVFWQLTPNGRVSGITGAVDVNVFNGYQGQFDEFVRTGFHK